MYRVFCCSASRWCQYPSSDQTYRIVPNKCICLNKCAPRPSWQPTRVFWWNLPKHKWKWVKNCWKTSQFFNGVHWSLLGVCQRAGSIYSALYGILGCSIFLAKLGPMCSDNTRARPSSCFLPKLRMSSGNHKSKMVPVPSHFSWASSFLEIGKYLADLT